MQCCSILALCQFISYAGIPHQVLLSLHTAVQLVLLEFSEQWEPRGLSDPYPPPGPCPPPPVCWHQASIGYLVEVSISTGLHVYVKTTYLASLICVTGNRIPTYFTASLLLLFISNYLVIVSNLFSILLPITQRWASAVLYFNTVGPT